MSDDDVLAAWDTTVAAKPKRAAAQQPLTEHAPAARQQSDGLLRFLAGGGIGEDTAAAFGVYAAPWRFHAFPGADATTALVFPYRWAGREVNRGYRGARGAVTEYEAEATTLFNVDAVDASDPQVIVWAQREMDVLALHEAGYPQTVCLPQIAAPAPRLDPSDPQPEDRRFDAIETHAALLGRASKIILATDATEAGVALREELARRLGRHLCWLVVWPEGCATAGQVLQRDGKDALAGCVAQAEPYPIEGVQRLAGDTLIKLRRQAPPAVMTTGCGAADKVLALPTEGRLILVSGVPGHGKTAWVRSVMVHTMEHHDRRWAVFSPEMQPWETFVASCAEVFHGKQFWPDPKAPLIPSMTDDEIRFAEAWFRRRLVMLVSDAEDDPPTVDWIIDKARACVLREGITDLLIDPWNEMEHARDGMTETEYVGRSLQRLKAFGLRHGCNIWIIAHPTKLQPPKPGGKIEAPGIYDISGGANWANKADLAITIHTPASDNPAMLTQVLLRKARFRRFGLRGNMAELAFDRISGRYSTPTG